MNVIAIDPGERVGWAVGRVVGGVRQLEPLSPAHEPCKLLEVQRHGISALKDFALALYQAVAVERRYDAIVFETFRPRPKTAMSFVGNDMPTVQLIGMIRLCAWVTDTSLYPQGPDAKTSARMSLKNPGGEDIRARLAKMPKSHDDAHDGDALLHLWNFYFDRFA